MPPASRDRVAAKSVPPRSTPAPEATKTPQFASIRSPPGTPLHSSTGTPTPRRSTPRISPPAPAPPPARSSANCLPGFRVQQHPHGHEEKRHKHVAQWLCLPRQFVRELRISQEQSRQKRPQRQGEPDLFRQRRNSHANRQRQQQRNFVVAGFFHFG